MIPDSKKVISYKRNRPEQARASESKINPAVLKAKAEIEKNFTNPDFNINSLVAELPICSSHLRSEFKKSFSLSPIDYLKYVRLQNAISLLISNYYSIEEVALKSGYGSVSYFVQAFRKSTTYSPTKYREKFLTQEKQMPISNKKHSIRTDTVFFLFLLQNEF